MPLTYIDVMIFKANTNDPAFMRRVKAFTMFPFLIPFTAYRHPVTGRNINELINRRFDAYFEFPEVIVVRRSYDRETDTRMEYEIDEIMNCDYYVRKDVSVSTDPSTGAKVHVDEIHTEKKEPTKAAAIMVSTVVKTGGDVQSIQMDFYTDYI